MPGDEAEINPAVLAARLRRVELDILSANADISKHSQRLEYLANEKLSRDEFNDWTHDAGQWREEVVKHLTVIDGRLGMWAGGNVVLTIIAGIIAAIVGRGP